MYVGELPETPEEYHESVVAFVSLNSKGLSIQTADDGTGSKINHWSNANLKL